MSEPLPEPTPVAELLDGSGWIFDGEHVTQERPYEPWAPVWRVGSVDAHLHNHGWRCWIEPGETTITVEGPITDA